MPLQATSGAASYDAFGGGVPVAVNYIEDVFSTYLYTGNATSRSINNGIDLLGKGGLLWAKSRDSSNSLSNYLVDTARGDSFYLYSEATNAQANLGAGNSFSNTGFNLSSNVNLNANTERYASWTFRKQPKFFDVLTYTGNGASSRAISHNLGSAPGCIIIKRTNTTSSWAVYHRSLGSTDSTPNLLFLNSTGAAVSSTAWDNTAPTTTTFNVDDSSTINASGSTYVAYLFAHNAGGFGLTGTDNVILCGSYTGNGSSSGPVVTLGYEPQWVLIKNASSTRDWALFDNMRGMPVTTYSTQWIKPNTSEAESTTNGVYPTATGFEIKDSNPLINATSDTFIYIAIRRGPMKVPTVGTSVYNAIARTGTGTTTSVTGVGFPPDMALIQRRNGGGDSGIYDKLRGPNILLYPQYTLQEFSVSSYLNSFDQDGETLGTNTPNISGETFINWNFRRAPSVFDIVCYTGTGGASQTFTHNLGVAPELVIVKNRSDAAAWESLGTALTASQRQLYLNRTQAGVAVASGHLGWNGTDGAYKAPTSTLVYFGGDSDVGGSGNTYVAYLFATCAGVSKVGSYTGTGTTLQIDCGFTAGARFVLIKRTDSTGDWYVWDSTRGIVSGNDPYLVLNNGVAEVTSTDYIDTYSAGFEISSTAPAAINASGGTFIFLAIA
jgi:hypothetical protein